MIKNSNLAVKDEEGKIINQVSLAKIFAVFLSGNGTFSATLIKKLIENGAILVLMNLNFKPYCVVGGETEGNTLLREKQYLAKDNLEKAKWITENKISNQLILLKNKRKKNSEEKNTIKKLEQLYEKIEITQFPKEILGLE